MPPRYAYWTIIAGGLPTAFRMTEREELLPTFRRIKQKHPDAEMKYFARGRLWGSPNEARVESERLRAEADARRSARAPSRGRAWRPGGEHQDSRQKFKDAKKVRNQDRRQERFDRRHKAHTPPADGDTPTRPAAQSARAPRTDWRDRSTESARPPASGDRPWNDRGPRTQRPPASGDRPWSDRPPRDRPRDDRPPREDRGGQGYRGKPTGARDRPWNDHGPRTPRPPSSSDRPWTDRPPRDRPRDDRPRDDRQPRDDRGGQGYRGKPPAARDRPWNDHGPRTPRPPRDDRGGQGFRGKASGGDNRTPGSTRPAPRSGSRPGSKPGGSYGSPKGSWARKPESKSRTSGAGGRAPGRPDRDRHQRGPAKGRNRR